MGRGSLVDILLIEDNPGDASLVGEILNEAKVLTRVHHMEDGARALAFLRRETPHTEAPRPQLIILDLSLPGLDGRELLENIKADADLRAIPVIVLTSSQTPQDIRRSHDAQANCFIAKPRQPDDLAATVRTMVRFWLEIVTLPEG